VKRLQMLFVLLAGLFLPGIVSTGHAQTGSLDDVYATIQYTASLRAGAGTHWERLAVLPYGVTYRVTGRTQDAAWIQIAYTGELLTDRYPEATIDGVTYGWVSTRLTFWTGNLFGVPVDGVPTVNFLRGSLATLVITPDEPIYTGLIGPQQRVPYPLPDIGIARVEATGRYGTPPYIWVQFKIGPDYYWVSRTGWYSSLPDVGQLIAGNRLALLAERNYNRVSGAQSSLESLWTALASGQPISCNSVLGAFSLIDFSENDLRIDPIYGAAAVALETAAAEVDQAADRLRSACAAPELLVGADEINAALNDLAEAERALNLAQLSLPLDS
jgi:uncharacterized protein YraI